MKLLIPRTLILHFSSPSPLRPSILFLHSTAGEEAYRRRTEPSSLPSNSSSYSHSFTSSSSPRRNYDEESRSVKVTVWWDFENCSVPCGVNVERVANRITSALRSSGIKGPITITAFGDVAQMSRATQEALTSTGVCLNHVPHRGKNSSDRSFMADLVYWVSQNPPPVHFFLISGDKDFANILHRLRMSNYNVLLASNDLATGVLCSAATIMWPWVGLVKGEKVTPKHFNHPPDGLYGSWYGHYKGALDDPLLDSEQTTISQPEEPMELVSETKIRLVPKAVVNGIRTVLHSYPEGMYISELRAELKRKNVPMDKDFYGHKKFSYLLSSMPSVVKFIPNPSGDNQPLVADRRVAESVEFGSKPATESAELSSKPAKEIETSELHKGRTLSRDEKPSPVAPPTTVVEFSPCRKETDVDTSEGVSTPPQVHHAVAEGGLSEKNRLTFRSNIAEQGHNAKVKEGFFKRIWTTLTGRRVGHPHEKNNTMSVVDSATSDESIKDDHSKILNSAEKAAQSKGDFSDPLSSASSSSGANKSAPEDKTMGQSDKNDTHNLKIGFFYKIANLWLSWKSGAKDLEDGSESVKRVKNYQEANVDGECLLTRISCHPDTHELFSQTYFWCALELFLLTPKGSDLVMKSSTRDQLVHGLQKEGPRMLKDLKQSHLLHLIDLLILEKKWVEESASQTFPFKLTLPAKRKCFPSNAHDSHGLSSLFTGRRSQPNSQKLPEQLPEQENSGLNPYSVSVEAMPPQSLEELKAWFLKTCSGTQDIEPEEFQKLFESKFNKKLVCSSYGYPTIRSLFFACSTDTGIDRGKMKKPPNREEILSDCYKLLTELFKENPEGFNMSMFRPAFIQRYGYVLDYQMLGYPKLVSLLQIMPGVRVESSFILPAAMLNSDSKPLFTETLTDSPEHDRGKVFGLDRESPSNGEDWEELGPLADSVISDNNKTNQQMDKQVSFSEASLSDEEFTDSEDETPPHFDGSEGHSRRGEEDSSLLQILDSWYSSKEGGAKDQVQAEGLVDCSRSSAQNPSNVKPVESQKLKVRPQKRYSFVSDSGDDEKDKLVESILGSLKKAGDSRLQS